MYGFRFRRVSNRADFTSPTIRLRIKGSTDVIDLTGASITVEIKDQEDCSRLSGTLDDGKVQLIGGTTPTDGTAGLFQFSFSKSDMQALCPGTHGIGVAVLLNGFKHDLVIGSAAIVEGVNQ